VDGGPFSALSLAIGIVESEIGFERVRPPTGCDLSEEAYDSRPQFALGSRLVSVPKRSVCVLWKVSKQNCLGGNDAK
jgi:hypothetical protein